jgi:hypothetical protein
MEQAIGAEGKLKVAMVDGKLRLEVGYDGKQLDAGLFISVDSDQLVDAIMDLVPGDSAFEKSMGMLLKAALKGLKV